jgi:2-keto-4-pentenoate hydratase/2-oxohepta-3-ene-1,7-dioic acid hydratase in catechol pathway
MHKMETQQTADPAVKVHFTSLDAPSEERAVVYVQYLSGHPKTVGVDKSSDVDTVTNLQFSHCSPSQSNFWQATRNYPVKERLQPRVFSCILPEKGVPVMRFCRFDDGRFGLVEGSNVKDVTSALEVLPNYRYPFPPYDLLIANLDKVAERARSVAVFATSMPTADLKFLSPVANPSKVIGAPVNYQKHLDEVKNDATIHNNNQQHMAVIHKTGLFLKASSSLVGPAEGIRLRKLDRRNDHEVELAVIIGRRANNVSREDALKYVAGYAIGLDITIRGPEERSLRKSADSYAVLGPWLVTADEIPDPGDLNLKIAVNGEERQNSSTKYMILGVPELIEFASAFYTLNPGDVIMTGTPEGVSPIEPGDRVVATIEKIGTMEVTVHAA